MPGPRPGASQDEIPNRETQHREALHSEVPRLAIEVAVSAGTATILLRGELDLTTMPLLARRLAQVLADGPRQLVLDMAGVTFMDCASARLITGAGRHLPCGTRPAIHAPSLAVRRVLVLSGLTDRLEIGPAGSEWGADWLPGAPLQARRRQRWRLKKRGRRAEVERTDG